MCYKASKETPLQLPYKDMGYKIFQQKIRAPWESYDCTEDEYKHLLLQDILEDEGLDSLLDGDEGQYLENGVIPKSLEVTEEKYHAISNIITSKLKRLYIISKNYRYSWNNGTIEIYDGKCYFGDLIYYMPLTNGIYFYAVPIDGLLENEKLQLRLEGIDLTGITHMTGASRNPMPILHKLCSIRDDATELGLITITKEYITRLVDRMYFTIALNEAPELADLPINNLIESSEYREELRNVLHPYYLEAQRKGLTRIISKYFVTPCNTSY